MKRLGIDVGGTFTDVVLIDDVENRIWTTKVPSTPNVSDGVINGIRAILALSTVRGEEIGFLGQGTTLATNLVIQGRAARTALITTHGFRDILEIRRASRHDSLNEVRDITDEWLDRQTVFFGHDPDRFALG